MGPVPLHLWEKLRKTLGTQPDLITWCSPSDIVVRRGYDGKLGFRVHTYQGDEETFTVILKVKQECTTEGGRLYTFHRIIAINGHRTTCDNDAQVLGRLTSARGSTITLTSCQPYSFKIPSINGLKEIFCHASEGLIPNKKDTTGTVSPNSRQKKVQHTNIGKTALTKSFLEQLDEHNPNCHPGLPDNQSIKKDRHCQEQKNDRSAVNGNYVNGAQHVLTDVCEPGQRSSTDSSADSININQTGSTIVFKRGYSQVSGSSSNQSESGKSPESQMRRVQVGKSKGDNKGSKRLGNLNSSVSQDELEPLHPTTGSMSPLPLQLQGLHPELSALSLPYRNDPAVSMQDIVMFEDGPFSLPISPTVGISGTAGRGVINCPCPTFTVTPADQKVCGQCGTSSGVSGQKSPNPDVTMLLDSSQEHLSDDYCELLLQKPQLAVWDGLNTHVVELDKTGHAKFGFEYKVKIVKNEDNVDIYTLVESVVKNGPAKDKLRVGDWIRSVNGTPIQVPEHAFSLINTSGNILRLLVQRPVGFSQKPLGVHGNKPDKYIAENPSYSTSPQSSFREREPLMTTPIPGIIEPKKGPEKPVQPMNIYISQEASTCSNNESDICSLPFPKTVKLPKVRIFICGGEADRCASSILRETEIDLKLTGQGYCYCYCSMATDCFGNIVTSPPCANLYATSSQLPSSFVASASPGSHKDTGDLRCKSCGSDSISPSSQNALGTVVNIELFVISDDSFFHSCSNYLFTKSSIFILTFDGGKLLRSSACEFSRLQNLSHTIRSFAGDKCHIMSCGLLDSDTQNRNMADEVRALFYTPFNTQLQTFNVMGPELVNSKSSVLTGDNVSETKQLQALLWKVITETIQRQRVLHPLLLLCDHIHAQKGGDMFVSETQLMDMIRAKLPMYGVDVHQVVLTYLMNGEIILGKAAPFNNPKVHKIEPLVILEPKLLLDILHRIIATILDDKQTWARTISTGYISGNNLLSMCGHTETHAHYLIDFMESFGLVLRKPQSQTGGGNLEYFLPYFCVSPATPMNAVAMERKNYILYLQCNEYLSMQTFLQVMFYLAGQSDSPGSLTIQTGQSCSIHYNGIFITAVQEKVDDRLKFVVRREDKSSGIRLHELYKWLHSSCLKLLEGQNKHFLLGVPCPLGDKCASKSSSGLHIVDVSDTKAQYCGQTRVDQQKSVSVWRQKDSELSVTQSPPPQKQVTSPMDLGYTVFHRVCMKLTIPNDLGRDWRGLAGLMGYTSEDVSLFELEKEPVHQLLKEWSRSRKNSLEELMRHLENLEREDILTDIRQVLGHTSKSSPMKEATMTSNISNIALNSKDDTEVKGQGHTRKISNLELVDLDTNGQCTVSSTPVQVLTKANPLSDV